MNRMQPMLNTPETKASQNSLTLMDLWSLIRSRQTMILSVAASMVAIAVAFCVFSTREYKATAEIEIQRDSAAPLSQDSLTGGANGVSDVLEASRSLQTQARILESQTVALKVANDLDLPDKKDFQPHSHLISRILNLLTPRGVADGGGDGLENLVKRDHIVKVFQKNLKILPVPGTRLIDVTYTSSDPRLAAAAVNKMIDELIDYNFQTRFKATSEASDWLSRQLSDLRAHSEELQAEVAGKQKDSGVLSFGGENIQGKGLSYSTALDRLQRATADLTQAQSNRVLRGALFEAAKSGNPEMIAGLNSSLAANGTPSAVSNSLTLIQSLRDQEATQRAEISQISAKFGAAYPKLDEMRARLASIEQSIRAEQDRLQSQTRSDYLVAQQVETSMQTIFDHEHKDAEELNSKANGYQILHQEADDSRALYEKLLGRLKEAGVLEGMRSTNIAIVEPGRVPSRPAAPNVPIVLSGALLGGLVMGFLGALFLEVTDSKVRDAPLIGGHRGLGIVAELPLERRKCPAERNPISGNKSTVFSLADPRSPFSEALRSLRTAILLSSDHQKHQVILITSSISAEGKTTLATNLAASLAQQGKSVLLVDADLRSPRLHSIFGLPNTTGLGDLLMPKLFEPLPPSLHAIEDVPGLTVVSAGSPITGSAELLGSDRMRNFVVDWRELFDFVIVDGEPILPVTDSIVLTPLVDQVLLVARHGITERSMLEKSLRMILSACPDATLGIVINAIQAKADSKSRRYHNSYGFGKRALLGGVQSNA